MSRYAGDYEQQTAEQEATCGIGYLAERPSGHRVAEPRSINLSARSPFGRHVVVDVATALGRRFEASLAHSSMIASISQKGNCKDAQTANGGLWLKYGMLSCSTRLKDRAIDVLQYMGDEAHRRFVVALVVWAVVHFGGKEIAPDVVDSAFEAGVTGLLAMWSSRTPKLDDDRVG